MASMCRYPKRASKEDGLLIFVLIFFGSLNVAHVPTGCAVWPAFWTVTSDLDNWPVGGEIDIAENANDQYPGALSSLHTDSDCDIASSIPAQTGSVQAQNCSAHADGNPGCRVELPSTNPASWGAALNAAGGGTYAMERSMGSTGNGVRVWFWANGTEPADLASSSQSVDTSTWGKPGADFDVADSCHSQFGQHKITFDITLCGDWAANTYTQSGCGAQYPACSFQVGYNGSSFNQSYWSIYDLRVFASGGGTDNAANSPNTYATSSATRLFATSGILAAVTLIFACFTVSL
jgi:hypothetical protein